MAKPAAAYQDSSLIAGPLRSANGIPQRTSYEDLAADFQSPRSARSGYTAAPTYHIRRPLLGTWSQTAAVWALSILTMLPPLGGSSSSLVGVAYRAWLYQHPPWGPRTHLKVPQRYGQVVRSCTQCIWGFAATGPFEAENISQGLSAAEGLRGLDEMGVAVRGGSPVLE